MGLTVAELEQEVVSQGVAHTGLLTEVVDARGTAGTLGARLDVALNPDGTPRTPVATVSFVTEIAPIISYPPTGAYVALEGDLTAVYVAKRRLRINGALLPYVTSSTYDAGGDYTVVNFSTPVGNSITSVEYSFDPAAMPPLHYSGNPDIEQVVSGISTFATKHLSDAQYKSLLDDILARVTITSLASVDDGEGVDLVGRAFKYVDTIDDLRTLTPTDAPVYIQGHTVIDDGGQGTFRWYAASTAADDNGVTIAVTGVATGRWVRQLNGFVTPEMFGATGGSDATDGPAFLSAALFPDYKIILSNKTYRIANRNVLFKKNVIEGNGRLSTVIQLEGTATIEFGGDDIKVYGNGIRDCSIQGINNTTKLIYFNGLSAWKGYVKDCNIIDGTVGIFADNRAYEVQVIGCRLHSFTDSPLVFTDTANSWALHGCDIAPMTGGWSLRTGSQVGYINSCHFETGGVEQPNGHILLEGNELKQCIVFASDSLIGATRSDAYAVVVEEGSFYANNCIFAPHALHVTANCSIGPGGLYNTSQINNSILQAPGPDCMKFDGGYAFQVKGCQFFPLIGAGFAENDALISGTLSSGLIADNEFRMNTDSKVYITDMSTGIRLVNNKAARMLGSLNLVDKAIGNTITAATIDAIAIKGQHVEGNTVTCASATQGIYATKVAKNNILGANTGMFATGARVSGNVFTITTQTDFISGVATITAGSTYVSVDTSKMVPPIATAATLAKLLSVTPAQDIGTRRWWAEWVSSVSFRIYVDSAPGTNLSFYYKVAE